MTAEIYLDTRTAQQWAAVTRVIPKGFACVELGENAAKIKIGDGVNTYAQLPYSGDDMAQYYTKSEVDKVVAESLTDLGSLFTLKGRVDDVSMLPENAKKGDVYLVGAEEAAEYQEYYRTGTAWDFMGKTASIDMSDYYQKSEVDAMLDSCVKKNEKLVLNCVLEADK